MNSLNHGSRGSSLSISGFFSGAEGTGGRERRLADKFRIPTARRTSSRRQGKHLRRHNSREEKAKAEVKRGTGAWAGG